MYSVINEYYHGRVIIQKSNGVIFSKNLCAYYVLYNHEFKSEYCLDSVFIIVLMNLLCYKPNKNPNGHYHFFKSSSV